MVHGFAHIALYTADFEKAVTFYKNVFDATDASECRQERLLSFVGRQHS